MSKTMTAQIEDELAEKVDSLATRLDRSRSWLIAKALEQLVAVEEERDRLTREGMASVRAGRVVPHGDVRAWAESLGTDSPKPLPTAPVTGSAHGGT